MGTKPEKRRGLGRGLSALMADVEPQGAADAPRRADRVVPIEKLVPNPDQPRRSFTQPQLEELAASIRAKGVIQPLIVRVKPGTPDQFEIVAGERRWRAAQMAQLHELPVIVRDFDDTEVLEVAIIENIQRADLSVIEEAAGYKALMYKFGHTQEKLAQALGKSRSHIANLMRLLNLPQSVQDMVNEGQLSAGHARAIIVAGDPEALARHVVATGLSVRETEDLVKQSGAGGRGGRPAGKRKTGGAEKDADTRALEAELSAALGMSVTIDHSGGEKGRVTIAYGDLDQLDTLVGLLGSAR